jgi:hypothetical protein
MLIVKLIHCSLSSSFHYHPTIIVITLHCWLLYRLIMNPLRLWCSWLLHGLPSRVFIYLMAFATFLSSVLLDLPLLRFVV